MIRHIGQVDLIELDILIRANMYPYAYPNLFVVALALAVAQEEKRTRDAMAGMVIIDESFEVGRVKLDEFKQLVKIEYDEPEMTFNRRSKGEKKRNKKDRWR